jgi:hypothetical protein
MDEHVLKGNSAILKCHIPSFVSDFVLIDAWIDEETGDEIKPNTEGTQGSKKKLSKEFLIKLLFLTANFLLN